MHNTFFRFKQFTIHQDRCAMKVGTDGVLLGAWTDITGVASILDVGSGTGLVSLMLAQRSNAEITGVEIDAEAVGQSRENISASAWHNRIQILHTSFQDYILACTQKTVCKKFDLIVSNPPFHPEHIKPESHQRRLARHSDELSPAEVLEWGRKVLLPGGKIVLIVPQKILPELLLGAELHGLYLTRQLCVKPTPQKAVHRNLLSFSLQPGTFSREELIVEMDTRHNYSEDYIELTRDYYLGF